MAMVDMLSSVESMKKIKEGLKTPGAQLLTGVIDAQKTHVIANLFENQDKPMAVVTYSERKAKEIEKDLSFFLNGTYPLCYYPARDMLFYAADSRSRELDIERLEVLYKISRGEKQLVVLSLEALFGKMLPVSCFLDQGFSVALGTHINLEDLLEKLINAGYQRTDILTGKGQFSLRGGIVDIFSPGYNEALRLDFWGDEIDRISFLDTANRLSTRNIKKDESIHIFPAREFIFTTDIFEKGLEVLKKAWEREKKKAGNPLDPGKEKLNTHMNEILEKMDTERYFPGMEKFISFFYPTPSCFLEYLPMDTPIIWDEPRRLSEHGKFLETEFANIFTYFLENNELFPMAPWYLSYGDILHQIRKKSVLALSTLTTSIPDFPVKHIESMTVKSLQFTEKSLEGLVEELLYYERLKYKVVVLVTGKTKGERLSAELHQKNIKNMFVENLHGKKDLLAHKEHLVTVGNLSSGFEYPLEQFVLISSRDLFGEEKKKKRRRKRSKDRSPIDSFTDLVVGDFVVHDNHGIGVYRGIENIESAGVAADYLKISYADGGNLYVHTGQMNLIQKYIGGEASKPKINKLGRNDWLRAKNETRVAVKKLAFDIVNLEAKRAKIKGHAFGNDSVWQREFEEAFPYDETSDQEVAIEEMKEDMESTAVMDRLICGDVGYGKTEVGIRGAFKAVQDSKQVAFLVPTTILAQQHYNTFLERFRDFPVTVELLSRFRTLKEQKEILKRLEDGRVDILIGTHRLLSKDVKFNDLGLLIIDEEQRFGVGDKEKLKNLKENVDVLTLTATPIPRTLHMSLSGIRKMSLLTEPPEERKPVQTYVLEDESLLIREAIQRELDRGGQVYYLFNRVIGIEQERARLLELLPDASISFAHGQMHERELEKVMMDFIEGDIDVLVSTTIVETGLDIPNVNTIIITHADKMGLSQLYQLRGRVGRSHRLAYCYLLYTKNKVLSDVATKRLQTIREFTEFGAGFKIAMRDLEIRGAGDLLGAEQHGFMNTVGYDTYSKILAEEVLTLQGKELPKEPALTMVELKINGYIPDYYITNENEKLDMYKRIAYIKTQEMKEDLEEELVDMYGNLPVALKNLLEVSLLQGLANKLGISKISEQRGHIMFYFEEAFLGDTKKIEPTVTKYLGRVFFTAGSKVYLSYKLDPEEELSGLLPIFQEILTSLKK